MSQPSAHRPLVRALYVNAALLLAILLAVVFHGGGSTLAQGAPSAPAPIAGGNGLYLMPGQLLNNVWGCYVLDTDNLTLTTYAYNGNQLKLIAARAIRYDRLLGNYNTHPDPQEIRKLVEIERDKSRVLPAPNDNPPPAATQPASSPLFGPQ